MRSRSRVSKGLRLEGKAVKRRSILVDHSQADAQAERPGSRLYLGTSRHVTSSLSKNLSCDDTADSGRTRALECRGSGIHRVWIPTQPTRPTRGLQCRPRWLESGAIFEIRAPAANAADAADAGAAVSAVSARKWREI